MRIVTICGSQRVGSQSLVMAELIDWRLNGYPAVETSEVVSPVESGLPMWDTEFPNNSEGWHNIYANIESSMENAHGFIVCVPEYNGMVPPILKNLFLLDRKRIFANKPGLIVSISEGLGGTYPIAELRMSSYKNTKICWIPEHIILRRVSQLTTATQQARLQQTPLPKSWGRIDHTISIFIEYVKALTLMRDNSTIDLDKYQNGM